MSEGQEFDGHDDSNDPVSVTALIDQVFDEANEDQARRMMEALKLAVDNEQKRDDGINEIVQRLRQLELRLSALESDVGRLQR